MSMKNSNDTIGNQTRDLLACSSVLQPTAPPHTLNSLRNNGIFWEYVFIGSGDFHSSVVTALSTRAHQPMERWWIRRCHAYPLKKLVNRLIHTSWEESCCTCVYFAWRRSSYAVHDDKYAVRKYRMLRHAFRGNMHFVTAMFHIFCVGNKIISWNKGLTQLWSVCKSVLRLSSCMFRRVCRHLQALYCSRM